MKKDLVSIIMPTYNRANLIKKSIDSLLKQTYENIEIIVVDDASTDNTEEIIKKIADKRVIYYKLPKNAGACYARNYGIKKARGNYITFQDSDDKYLANKVEEQYNNLIKNKSDVDFCITAIHNKNGKFLVPTKEHILGFEKNGIFSELHKGNFISTQTIFAKKQCLMEEMFDDQLPRLQDFDLVLRLSKKYKFSFTNKHLVNAYVQEDSISSKTDKYVEACRLIMSKDYSSSYEERKILVQNLLHSCIHMTNEEIIAEKDKILANEIYNKDLKINNLNQELITLNKENKATLTENKKLNKLYKTLEESYLDLNNNYNKIINSKRWKLANKILNLGKKSGKK